jgi:hypothetical protein
MQKLIYLLLFIVVSLDEFFFFDCSKEHIVLLIHTHNRNKKKFMINDVGEIEDRFGWGRIRPIFPMNPIFLKNPIICRIYRSVFLFYLYFVEKIGNAQKIDQFH